MIQVPNACCSSGRQSVFNRVFFLCGFIRRKSENKENSESDLYQALVEENEVELERLYPGFKFFISLDFIGGIMSYYAVAKGRKPGIYSTWDQCKEQVHKFSGPVYKKFSSKSEAEEFIKSKSGASSGYSKTSAPKKTTSALTSSLLGNQKSQKRCLSNSSDDESSTSTTKRKYHKSILLSSVPSKGSKEYVVDNEGYTEVYTDGACTSNGRGNAKAGIGIWFHDDCLHNVSQPVVGRATNNMAEIQAVTIAAKQARKAGIKKLKISTDSEFLIKCKTMWMPKWKKNGWRTAKGEPVINKTELIEMEDALASLDVIFNHVRGHQGIYGNEMADKFAREGSERYREK